MNTKFIHTKINVGKNIYLCIDGNSKITAGNGTYENPVPNAFSLPHISTCPGSTKICMSTCYVYGLQKYAPEVYAEYCKNERAIHQILMTARIADFAASEFAAWISEYCSGGFRWHVSGDVMNERHALWIVNVADKSPEIQHWIYTRSINLVPILRAAKNLIVNISADVDNYIQAREMANQTKSRICYLSQDGAFPDNLKLKDVIFPDYQLRGRELEDPISHQWWKSLSIENQRKVCPADFFGQSNNHRCGPCSKCLVNPGE
jgi:hypothetical protein